MTRICVVIAMAFLAACATQSQASDSIDFRALLAPPSEREIASAEKAWAAKSRNISDVRSAGRTRLVLAGVSYDVDGFTYRLNGSQRCGTVLIPQGNVAATLVDLSDVRWDYPPRDISRGPFIATILGDRANEAALVIPCFRGMTLKVNDLVLTAQGDRRDAWEGATEDARAFLTVALRAVPQLPQQNIIAYGSSRGGGVALLFGERDPRVKRIAAFAAPTDFFSAMGRPGTDWPTALERAKNNPNLEPDTRERQFLDWFVETAPNGTIGEMRHKILMSSAAYFLKHLPETQVHHGSDDTSVPAANARLVADFAARHGQSKVRVFIYPDEGHNVRSTAAFTTATKFLLGN